MKKIFIIIMLLATNSFAEIIDCPNSYNQFTPYIEVETKFLEGTEKTIYAYSVGIDAQSKGWFGSVNLLTNEPLKVTGLEKNSQNFVHRNRQFYQLFVDYLKRDSLSPGAKYKLSSFEGSSYNGLVPVRLPPTARAKRAVGRSKFEGVKYTPCPGYYGIGSTGETDPYMRSLTLAPIPKNQKSAISLINQDGIWKGSVHQNFELLKLSSLDKGTKEILILGSKNFDVKDLDVSTLRIGQGQAKAKNIKKLKTNAVNNIDPLSKVKSEFDNLSFEFDLEEANVRCDIDHALYIEGKTKAGNPFFSGVRIKPVLCDLNTFSKEMPSIKKATEIYESGK